VIEQLPFCRVQWGNYLASTSTTAKMGSGLETRRDVQNAFLEILRDEFDIPVLNLVSAIHPISSFEILPVAIW
jgi:hypothetical protein